MTVYDHERCVAMVRSGRCRNRFAESGPYCNRHRTGWDRTQCRDGQCVCHMVKTYPYKCRKCGCCAGDLNDPTHHAQRL